MRKNCVPRPLLSTGLRLAGLTLALGLAGCANLPFGGKPEALRGGYAPGDKVTVMLPGAGPVADVADAVREGVRAAHGADDTGTAPKLAFADTPSPAQVPSAYADLVGGGSTQVIGPLEKPAVDALASGSSLKVPTLALNEVTGAGKPPANLYQFSLSPESEGIDVANKALKQGFKRAHVLYSTDSGGTRRADAFRKRWRSGGGTLVGEEGLDPKTADYQGKVSKVLASGAADFLFLAADADQARAIYPGLRGTAGALPVVATPSVYGGDADPARDRALAGLYFVDMPWMLGVAPRGEPLTRAGLKSSASYLATPLGRRLYAMGIDAYRLTPRLSALAAKPGAAFPGQTGRLSVNARGSIERDLTLAQFTETGPRPADTIAATATARGAQARAPEARAPRPEPVR